MVTSNRGLLGEDLLLAALLPWPLNTDRPVVRPDGNRLIRSGAAAEQNRPDGNRYERNRDRSHCESSAAPSPAGHVHRYLHARAVDEGPSDRLEEAGAPRRYTGTPHSPGHPGLRGLCGLPFPHPWLAISTRSPRQAARTRGSGAKAWWDRLKALDLEFVGPRAPNGRRPEDPPADIPVSGHGYRKASKRTRLIS